MLYTDFGFIQVSYKYTSGRVFYAVSVSFNLSEVAVFGYNDVSLLSMSILLPLVTFSKLSARSFMSLKRKLLHPTKSNMSSIVIFLVL